MKDFIEYIAKPIAAYVLFAGVCILAVLMLFSVTAHASQARYNAAKAYIGLKEGTKAANRAMGVNTRAVPWCGHYVRAVVRRTGGKVPASYASGGGWSRFGKAVKLSHARKGDIVTVYSRPARSKRHVGIYSHRSKGKVCLISGNSRNQVRMSCYAASKVRAVRR